MTRKTLHILALSALTALLGACRTVKDTVRTEHVRASRDTVRLVSLAHDTVRVSDSVTVRVWERGDSVVVWRDRVRTEWRTRVERDTVRQASRDTVRAAEERRVAERRGGLPWRDITACAGASLAFLLLLWIFERIRNARNRP